MEVNTTVCLNDAIDSMDIKSYQYIIHLLLKLSWKVLKPWRCQSLPTWKTPVMFVCQTVWSHPGGLVAKSNSSNFEEMRTGHHKMIIMKFSHRMFWAKRHWAMWKFWAISTSPYDKILTSVSWKCYTAATMAKRHHGHVATCHRVQPRSWMHQASWMIFIVILWTGPLKMWLRWPYLTWFSCLMPLAEVQRNFFKYPEVLSPPFDGRNQVDI